MSEAVERLGAQRRAIFADHAGGAPGHGTAKRLSDSLDEAVRSVWQEAGAPEGAALVALGEYGRGELAPSVEIDLLVLLSGQEDDSHAVSAAKNVCNELYAAGIEADFRAHTVGQSLALAEGGIESEIALLDARVVAGESGIVEDWTSRLVAQSRRSEPPFVERLRRAAGDRHFRMDEATASLEPDLKEGKGGLEDLATIGWILKVHPEQRNELPVSMDALSEAASFLHRVRAAVHLFTGRNTDLLQMDYQRPVGEALLGTEIESAEMVLMRSLYEKGRLIAFALDRLLSKGLPEREESARFIDTLGPEPAEGWPPDALPAFIELLSSGSDCRSCLQILEHSGALVHAIPEWEAVRCLPQRNIYHRFAVDVHLFETVDALRSLSGSADEVIRTATEQIVPEDRNALLVAALLHDIGKGEPSGDHCVTGEEIARKVTARMGFDRESASEIAWLVGNHLLLSETATKRNIGDEDLISDLGARIGSVRRLRMLYLLTVADALATGPQAWGTWKATLVRRLFERVSHFLERGSDHGTGDRRRYDDRAQELRSALGEHPGIDEHLRQMPREWLASQSLSALAKQSSLMMDFSEDGELSISASADQEAGVWEVIVVADDRPGLFSKIAGSLALHDLNVVGAQAFTRGDGVALEVIRVEALSDEDQRFEHVSRDARRALQGKLALDARVAEKRLSSSQDRPPKGKQEPTGIVVDNEASADFTLIEVHASDRIGRLYDITRAMAELELDIHIAKVSTYAEDIVDVFYVTDLDRHKVTDTEYLREIEKAILHRL